MDIKLTVTHQKSQHKTCFFCMSLNREKYVIKESPKPWSMWRAIDVITGKNLRLLNKRFLLCKWLSNFVFISKSSYSFFLALFCFIFGQLKLVGGNDLICKIKVKISIFNKFGLRKIKYCHKTKLSI